MPSLPSKTTRFTTLQLRPNAVADVGMKVSLTSGHTGDALQVINSAGTVLFKVDASGNVTETSMAGASPAITTGINDANNLQIIGLTPTASAVNNLNVANAATGNGPVLSAIGETNTPITLNSKGTGAVTVAPGGAGGTVVIGHTGQTAAITLGSSTAASTVNIANGAGAPTVAIANASTAGATVSIAGAATATGVTDTINIGTGNTVGTGSKVIHIGDGTPAGTNVITIGSNANTANTTTIQGGNGAGAIALTPQTTGTIVIGAAAGTGLITVGNSSATQVVSIGIGAGISTVNLATVSVAGANVNMATAATGAGITDTVAISTGNAAATGIKVVNILTGTPGTSGNNRLTMGGGSTSKVTINAAVTSYQEYNLQLTETGANNAIAAALTDAGGNNITLATGVIVTVKLAHSLQAGANTFNFNAGGAVNLKSSRNPANNIGTAYVSGGFVTMFYDGTQWLDCNQ